jgi:hypothetical protein
MKAGDIEKLLSLCGCSMTQPRWDWINAPCPFASWRHGKGTDRKPSFGIKVDNKGESRVRCLSCGLIGNLRQFVWRLARYRGYGEWFKRAGEVLQREGLSEEQIDRLLEFSANPASMRSKLEQATYWKGGPAKPRQAKRKAINLDSLNYQLVPEAELDKLEELPPQVLAYLTGPRRKLTPFTIDLWGLRWNPYRRRIMIPVRDWKGKLVALTGRAMDKEIEPGVYVPEQKPKFMHSKGFHRDFFLFGEHLVEQGDTGYLIEGHWDAMYLRQMGYGNAVAVMGSHFSGIQVEKAVTMFKEIVILPDGDKAGGEAALRWEHALKGRRPVAVADCVPDLDPDDYDQYQLEDLLSVDNLSFS